MDLNLVLRLESRVDLLLARNHALEEECRQLRREISGLLDERQRIRAEIDRIIAKLPVVESGAVEKS